MNFETNERLTPDLFLEWLAACGNKATQITIIRYAKQGYMIEQRWRSKLEGKGRVFYHKLAPIECLTAMMLGKGIMPTKDGEFKVVKFNGSDIVRARLRFYSANFDKIASMAHVAEAELAEFTTALPDPDNSKSTIQVPMQKGPIMDYLAKTDTANREASPFERHEYDQYWDTIEMLYARTFFFLLYKYVDSLEI